jgi:surfeit locus 1 family protein
VTDGYPAPRRRGFIIPAILTMMGLAALISLGVWQLERKAWKEELIARLEARLAAPAGPLPPRLTWDRLNQSESEFRRVTFPAEFLHEHEALVYGSGSALRPDVSGPGYWVFTPARLAGGSVVMVNRGFVPEGRQDSSSRREGQVKGFVDVVGIMRWPEPRGPFAPADRPDQNIWFVRDHRAIGAAKGLESAAPFYIEQETPPAPGGLPRVGKLQVNLPSNHLQYAITWFGLAGALLAVFVVWAARQRRR